jgi:hypothetical protein
MSSNSAQERKEDARREVRGFLAARMALAHSAKAVTRRLNVENDFTLEEVGEALTFLEGLGEVKSRCADLGATRYYQITSHGVLQQERGL